MYRYIHSYINQYRHLSLDILRMFCFILNSIVADLFPFVCIRHDNSKGMLIGLILIQQSPTRTVHMAFNALYHNISIALKEFAIRGMGIFLPMFLFSALSFKSIMLNILLKVQLLMNSDIMHINMHLNHIYVAMQLHIIYTQTDHVLTMYIFLDKFMLIVLLEYLGCLTLACHCHYNTIVILLYSYYKCILNIASILLFCFCLLIFQFLHPYNASYILINLEHMS